MDFGERAVEASTAFDDAERDRAIQRVRQSIAMQGDPDCGVRRSDRREAPGGHAQRDPLHRLPKRL